MADFPFHRDDVPCESSDPLTAHFFRVVAIRKCLKHSSSQEFEKSLVRRRFINNHLWLIVPLLVATHGLAALCAYLSNGGVNATIALKLFNFNRQQIEFCQKYSLPTCSINLPPTDKVDKLDKLPQNP